MKKRLLSFLGLLMILTVTGCKQKEYVADNTEHYDAITKKLKLNKEYAGKDFLSDGIGNAEVAAFTDGDTVRFNLPSNDSIVVRFYSVDTPESTSAIQKWGKAASHFVESTLNSATEIVLEATDIVAKHDSYGSRYLGYVWYKTAEYSTFKCLNLEIVENGYSENTGINTKDFPYYKNFNEAEQFAASIKLRTWSKKDDPDYDPSPKEMTIKEFYEDPTLWYNEEKKIGRRVKIEAYLSGLEISNTGTYSFKASEYHADENKVYTIDVYAGYSSSSASNMKVGHLYSIIGYVSEYYGNWQIADINYAAILTEGDDLTKVIQSDYYLTFDSKSKFTANYSRCLYSDVTVVSSKVEGETLTITGTTQILGENGPKGDVLTYTFTAKVASGYSNPFVEGKKFATSAYQFVAKSGNFTITNLAGVTLR